MADSHLDERERRCLEILQQEHFWRNGTTVRVHIIDPNNAEMCSRIKKGVEEWERYANIKFEFNCLRDASDIRVKFDAVANYTQIGTHCRHIENREKETMSLTRNTRYDIILHELGHVLSPNMSINAKRAGWSTLQTDQSVFVLHASSKIDLLPYDSRSIMHYYIPKLITGPIKGQPPIISDIRGGSVLSSKDKKTVIYAYSKPIGGLTFCTFLGRSVPERHIKSMEFPAPQFSIPRILMGVKTIDVVFTSVSDPSFLPGIRTVSQTGLELSFSAKHLTGSVTLTHLAVDPLTLGIYICPAILSRKRALCTPLYQESEPDREIVDASEFTDANEITDDNRRIRLHHLSPFDDQSDPGANIKNTQLLQYLADGTASPADTTVIVWINGIRLDDYQREESETTGRVTIDKKFARLNQALFSSATVEGCIVEATLSYMLFSKTATNIFGGSEDWGPAMGSDWRYLRILKSKFGDTTETVEIFAGVSQLRIHKPSSARHGLHFDIDIEPKLHLVIGEGENVVYRWRVVAAPVNYCLVSLSFDWVALTKRMTARELEIEDEQNSSTIGSASRVQTR